MSCSGNGRCARGVCACKAGYSGRDCSQACPGRCSGHGECANGTCYCQVGWQGDDCALEHAALGVHALLPSAWGWYPIGTAVLFAVAAVGTFILGGYLLNLAQGLRGTDAVPQSLQESHPMLVQQPIESGAD